MLQELGVQQVTIPLPYRLNHVNGFIAEGANGWTIIDAGLNTEQTAKLWAPIIEAREIGDMLITHHHPDHFGYAGTLQQLTNASVWMTEIEAQQGLSFWQPAFTERMKQTSYTFGFHDATFSDTFTVEGESFVQPYPVVNQYLEEGQVIPFGKYEYEVLITPGHSDGLITLFNEEQSILFSTDHILPHISPNISYWFEGEENPLGSYFASLEKIRALDVDRIIPSHGQPFRRGNERIEQLIAHHKERLAQTYEVIQHPVSIFEANAQLFSQVLTAHEYRFAIGETIAHLEYLYHQKQCQKSCEKGVWYYQAR
ncbi:MBL fold metallo-hydrolase [Lysinibacillus sp. KU-BSD001]|uniref:MBL fold metallo-hydrolase n=1 Tax=Lysinibacillus sp. KU-BSD001 TaxID=3141328 RepID=UPI0036E88A21